jgi:parvulin-like peptidyl-prolyl isomerase
VACCERDPEFRGYAKDNIISRVLLAQEAGRAGDEPSPEEVDETYAQLMEEHGGEEKFFMNMGIPWGDTDLVRRNVAQSLRVEKFLRKQGPAEEPDDQAVEAYYRENIALFLTDEERRVRHISKGMKGAKSRDEVYEALRKVRKELLDGADFPTVAERENDQEGQEIDLGYFKKGSFMEEFESIAFSMNESEISPIFTTQLGYHICQVVDIREPVERPLAEVREQAAQMFLAEKREAAVKALVDKLRGEAAIEDLDPEEGCGCGH